jgi:hypothetical protein
MGQNDRRKVVEVRLQGPDYRDSDLLTSWLPAIRIEFSERLNNVTIISVLPVRGYNVSPKRWTGWLRALVANDDMLASLFK